MMEVGSNPDSLLIAVPGPQGNFRKVSKMTFGGQMGLSGKPCPSLTDREWASRRSEIHRNLGSPFNLNVAGREVNQESGLQK